MVRQKSSNYRVSFRNTNNRVFTIGKTCSLLLPPVRLWLCSSTLVINYSTTARALHWPQSIPHRGLAFPIPSLMIIIRIYLSRCRRSQSNGRPSPICRLHDDPLFLSPCPALDDNCAWRVSHLAVDVFDLIQHLLVHWRIHHTVLLLWQESTSTCIQFSVHLLLLLLLEILVCCLVVLLLDHRVG